MPISAPGISEHRNNRARGFTLIELLVVLLVMGLCAGLVVAIARPDDRGQLRVEAMAPAESMRLEFGPYSSLAYDFQMSLGSAHCSVVASPLGEVRIHE